MKSSPANILCEVTWNGKVRTFWMDEACYKDMLQVYLVHAKRHLGQEIPLDDLPASHLTERLRRPLDNGDNR